MNKDSNSLPDNTQKAAYQLLPCGIVWTNQHQEITFVNDLLLKMLGFSNEQLVGQRRFNELLSIGGKLYFETYFIPILSLEGEVKETTFEMVDGAGNRHPVIVNVSLLPSPGEGYVYVVLPSKDRKKYERELKQARRKAEEADKAKLTFISSMSHEIRTPLHAVLEAGNFLLKDNPRADQLEFIQVLRSAGNSLLGIVNDILDISKMEAGMTTLDERPVHADQLVKQVVDTYGPVCRGKGVVLRAVLPINNVPLLLADGGKLIQVLNNLVSNAVKFTSEGEIAVTLEYEEENESHHLHFKIRDTGTGIPADRLHWIFEPFVQASETTHADYGGTGLGLAICKKILQACGSELKVNSKAGVGSEFYFTLTLRAASRAQRQEDQQPSTPTEELPPLNHLRVLNVDDNRSNLLINSRYFSEWKISFDQVTSGREALDFLEENSYDLVLLDLRMPVMDGYELARHIRGHSNPAIRKIPLIALSASASTEISAQMVDAGINGLVVKPFDPAYLHYIIRRYGEQEEAGKSGQEEVSSGSVDFSQVQEIFAGDPAEYLKFLRIIKDDVTEARQILEVCRENFDRKAYEDLKHNMISTLRVFLLDDLTVQFEEGKTALRADDRTTFLAVTERLISGLVAFQDELAAVLQTDR